MRTQVLSLDAIRSLAAHPLGEQAANSAQRRAAANVLWAAMEQELTPRQRQCVELCILRGMTQAEAGRLLGVGKSTVCRHLQKGLRALKRAARYAEPAIAAKGQTCYTERETGLAPERK